MLLNSKTLHNPYAYQELNKVIENYLYYIGKDSDYLMNVKYLLIFPNNDLYKLFYLLYSAILQLFQHQYKC